MHPSLKVFTPAMRLTWVAVVAVTVLSEVLLLPTNPPLPPLPHYFYKICKALLFIAVGYLAPLSFWRFNALNRGILLAAISAVFVETLQGTIGKGHSFHWYEMLMKLALILFGFACALDARYEHRISAGVFQIQLSSPNLRPNDPAI
jgi:hypothetical protein